MKRQFNCAGCNTALRADTKEKKGNISPLKLVIISRKGIDEPQAEFLNVELEMCIDCFSVEEHRKAKSGRGYVKTDIYIATKDISK